MSFKPIDLQVNISQINHVARSQQNEQAHPLVMQAHQQTHLAREAARTESTVMESAKTKDEDAVKDVLKRDENASNGGRHEGDRRQEEHDEELLHPDGKSFKGYVDGDKGGLIDIVR